jgi:tetratricopeptide (TPR) repeat protein
LLYTLMGLHEGPDPIAQMDPQIRRRRMLDAIKRIILRESLNQPTVVIFEDLHWIDGETRALLDLLADGIANARVLLLVNYRPEYRHEWGNKTYYAQLRLDALGRESAGEMLSTLLGDGVELDPLKRMVIERTEGNPFFIEEMVQALFDEGALVRNGAVKIVRSLAQLRLPPTVQGVLASRIDRLSAEQKNLLQTLAVMGRESALGLIRQVVSTGEVQLERTLADLQAGEFVYEQPALADIEYTFKHALTQEVAYNSLLIERRKLLHERAGAAIEALYTDGVEDHLSELARHYSCSANARKAVHFLGRAGRQAANRSAYAEALAFLTKALELLWELPEDTERALQEFDLQMALGWLVYQTKGPGAAERQAPVVRARKLAEQLGDEAKLTGVLIALANLMCNRGTPGMREVAEQALALAERGDDAALLAGAHYELGHVLYFFGEFSASNEHCERAFKLFGPGPYRTFWETENARWSATLPVWNSIFLGHPDTARNKSEDMLTAAQRSSDPASIAQALAVDALANHFLGDAAKVRQRAEEELAIGAEYGMDLHLFLGTFTRGWALAVQGQIEEGTAEMRRLKLVDLEGAVGAHMAALAEVYLASERPDEGLEAVSHGLTSVEETGQRNFDARLHQLQGELLLMQNSSNTEQAEGCFRTAVEIARRQGAKLFELIATTSLARLLTKQGRRDEARALLAEIYGWFTEGFDTRDLKEAKALLKELGT